MPYTVTDGSYLEYTICTLVDQQQCMSLFHYMLDLSVMGVPSIDGVTAINAFVAAVHAAGKIRDQMMHIMATDVLLNYEAYQFIAITRFARRVVQDGTPFGDIAGGHLPSGVAGGITKRGVLAGPHNVGVLHPPGVPKAWQSGSALTDPGFGAYQSTAAEIPVVLGGGDVDPTWRPVIFNRVQPALSPFIESVTAQRNLRTAYRRVLGRGI